MQKNVNSYKEMIYKSSLEFIIGQISIFLFSFFNKQCKGSVIPNE